MLFLVNYINFNTIVLSEESEGKACLCIVSHCVLALRMVPGEGLSIIHTKTEKPHSHVHMHAHSHIYCHVYIYTYKHTPWYPKRDARVGLSV